MDTYSDDTDRVQLFDAGEGGGIVWPLSVKYYSNTTQIGSIFSIVILKTVMCIVWDIANK